ncbi:MULTISPECIES: hypothetical protein [Mesorhizobium]|uniref:hypothetical protein n=1 Tax=Mesorhizobium TaxID=68287 RepID=UPI001FDA3B1A|nr:MULTISPECIES: hypothetical protein [Mesorhizobium]
MLHAMKPVLKADCSAGQSGEAIPFGTAVAKAIALAKPILHSETVSLVGALGRVCAAEGWQAWRRPSRNGSRRWLASAAKSDKAELSLYPSAYPAAPKGANLCWRCLERGTAANLMAVALADGIALLPPEAAEITNSMPIHYEPFAT